jgi:hypothetical protein
MSCTAHRYLLKGLCKGRSCKRCIYCEPIGKCASHLDPPPPPIVSPVANVLVEKTHQEGNCAGLDLEQVIPEVATPKRSRRKTAIDPGKTATPHAHTYIENQEFVDQPSDIDGEEVQALLNKSVPLTGVEKLVSALDMDRDRYRIPKNGFSSKSNYSSHDLSTRRNALKSVLETIQNMLFPGLSTQYEDICKDMYGKGLL